MFTLGDVADILDSALDTGISIVDTLARLSDIADEGRVNRQKCYEVLDIKDKLHENLDINDNEKPQFIKGNRENTAFNRCESDPFATKPLAIHNDNHYDNKSKFIHNDSEQTGKDCHSVSQAYVVDDKTKDQHRYERSGTYVLDQSPVKSAQEAALQGIPIIEALGDLCVVADNFLKDYNEPDSASQSGEQQDKPDHEGQTPDRTIVLENEINNKVNEILESFQKLDSTVDILKKQAMERFTENPPSEVQNVNPLDNGDSMLDAKMNFPSRESFASKRTKSPRPKTFVLHEVLEFPKHNETINEKNEEPTQLIINQSIFNKPIINQSYLSEPISQSNLKQPIVNSYNHPITDEYIESVLNFHSRSPSNERLKHDNTSNPIGYLQEVVTYRRQPKKFGLQSNRGTYVLAKTSCDGEHFLESNQDEGTEEGHENTRVFHSVDSTCASEQNTAKYQVTSVGHCPSFNDDNGLDDSPTLSRLFRSSSFSSLHLGESTLLSKLGNHQKSALLSQSLSDFDAFKSSDKLHHMGFLGDRTLSQPSLTQISSASEKPNIRKSSVGNVVSKLGMLRKVMSTSLTKLTELHAVKRQISISTNSLDEVNTAHPAFVSKTSNDLKDNYQEYKDTYKPAFQHSTHGTEISDGEQDPAAVHMSRQLSNSSGGTYTLSSPPPRIFDNDSSLLLIDEKESDDDETSEKVFIHTFTRHDDLCDDVTANELDAELSNVEDIIRNLEYQWSDKIENVFESEAHYSDHGLTSSKNLCINVEDVRDFEEVSSPSDLTTDKDVSTSYKEESHVKLREKKSDFIPRRAGTYVLDNQPRKTQDKSLDGRSSSYDADAEEEHPVVNLRPSSNRNKKKQRMGTYVLDSPTHQVEVVEIDFEDDLNAKHNTERCVEIGKSPVEIKMTYSYPVDTHRKSSTPSESFSTEEEESVVTSRHSSERSRRVDNSYARGRSSNVTCRETPTGNKFRERSSSSSSTSRKSTDYLPKTSDGRRQTRSMSSSASPKVRNRPPSLGRKSSSFTEGGGSDYAATNSKRHKNYVTSKTSGVEASNSRNNSLDRSFDEKRKAVTKNFLRRSSNNTSTVTSRKGSKDPQKNHIRTRSQTIDSKKTTVPQKNRSRSLGGDNSDNRKLSVRQNNEKSRNTQKPATRKPEKRNSKEFVPLHERTPKTSPVHTNFLRRSRPSFPSNKEESKKDGGVSEPLTERLTLLRMKLEEKRQRFEEEKKRQQALWNQERAKILQDAFFVMIADNETKQPTVAASDVVTTTALSPSSKQSASWEIHFEKGQEKPLEEKGDSKEDEKVPKLSPRESGRQNQADCSEMEGETRKQGLWFVGLNDESKSDRHKTPSNEERQKSADVFRRSISHERSPADQKSPRHQIFDESTAVGNKSIGSEVGKVSETSGENVISNSHRPDLISNEEASQVTSNPSAIVAAGVGGVVSTDADADARAAKVDSSVCVETASSTKPQADEREKESIEIEPIVSTQQLVPSKGSSSEAASVEVRDTPVSDEKHGQTDPQMISSTLPEPDQVVLKPPLVPSTTAWSHPPETVEDPSNTYTLNHVDTHTDHVTTNDVPIPSHEHEPPYMNGDVSMSVSKAGETTSLEQRLEDLTISDVNSSEHTYMTSTPMKPAVLQHEKQPVQSVENSVSDASQSETSATTPQGTSWGFTFGDEFMNTPQGMTPEQERKKARFLKNRLKKLEEGKLKKEAELEKKRKKEEKLAEQKAKEEEVEKLRRERLIEQQLKDVTTQLHQETFTKRIHELTYNVDLQPSTERRELRHFGRQASTPSPLIRRVRSPDTSEEASSNQFSEYKGPAAYQKPSGKSNRKIMQNAITHCCLCGEVNKDAKQKCLQAISQSDASHFLVLFREGLKFRSVYEYRPETETVTRIYGIGPKNITPKMHSGFFKYNSGGKEFNSLETKHLSIQVDGLLIKKELWEKKAGQTTKGNSLTKKKPAAGSVRPQSTR